MTPSSPHVLILVMKQNLIVGAADAISAFELSRNQHVDYIWASSFVMSAMLGLQDDGMVNIKIYLPLIRALVRASRCPVILDFDIGGRNIVEYRKNLLLLKKIKIGGVCIEDEHWPKMNAMLSHERRRLISPSFMAERIRIAKKVLGRHMVVIARTHSLLLDETSILLQERINKYQSAGANALCIHYTGKAWRWYQRRLFQLAIAKPLMLILSRENVMPRPLLSHPQIQFVLYPNQLYRVMINAARRFSHQNNLIKTKQDFVNLSMVRVDELFNIIKKINATHTTL